MRQRMSDKNVARLAAKTGLDLVGVYVRGGTDHRKDLCVRGGGIKCLWPDGTLQDSEFRHDIKQEGDTT